MERDLRRLMRHIENVQRAGLYMAEKLIDEGKERLARELIRNCMIHDNDKFIGYMWDNIVKKSEGDDFLRAVRVHRIRNRHHPECWGSINDMDNVSIAEMVCDWYARSCERGEGLKPWVENSSEVWKDIQEKTRNNILYFKNLIVEEYKWIETPKI